MAKINVGDPAPDFSLQTEKGETVSLEEARKKGPVVLIFYPMDNTPGCTAQLCAVRNDAPRYTEAGVSIEKHNLTAPLLVDPSLRVASAYDAVTSLGLLKFINRTVAGIGSDGTIAFYKRGTPSTDEILGALTAKA